MTGFESLARLTLYLAGQKCLGRFFFAQRSLPFQRRLIFQILNGEKAEERKGAGEYSARVTRATSNLGPQSDPPTVAWV